MSLLVRLAVILAVLAPLSSGAQEIVDEPIGARDSLGLTLWRMGHDPARIQEFHQFLQARGVTAADLLSADELTPPVDAVQVLLDPELLPPDQLGGWVPDGDWLTSGAGDAGPTVAMPLHVPRAGLYRLWVRYYGWPTGTGVTSLRIYRAAGLTDPPVLNDEVYDYATETEGPAWHNVMVDLEAGDYVVKLGHVTRWWHAGKGPAGYLPRRIDCLYLTDAIWSEAPLDADLQDLRESASPHGIQRTVAAVLDEADRALWRQWRVRPASWEQAQTHPRLFELSREFWRSVVDALGREDYGADVPDYRTPVRQVVFDDRVNMVGNPVRIRRQVETLKADVSDRPLNYRYVWVDGGDFDQIEGGWYKEGSTLAGGYWDFGGTASTEVRVNHPGRYHAWVRYNNLKEYYAPWRATLTCGDQTITYTHDDRGYPSDWDRMGELEIREPGSVRIEITPLLFKSPGTYRRIYSIILMTDPNFVPTGSVRPPISREEYFERAAAHGAESGQAYLAWVFPEAYRVPVSQEVWDPGSWPGTPEQARDLTARLTLAQDSVGAVQVGLRSLRDMPLTLRVRCSPLWGPDGPVADRVAWRVVGFVPYGEGRQDWSPFVLLRRPAITVPPLSAAGLWLTVDSGGLVPGDYTGQVTLSADGLPDRVITLRVRVSPVRIRPARPVLVGGWTGPPEGEVYMADYQAHGMRIWYSEMSKAEMQRWGIRLLALPQWDADAEAIRARIARLKAMGLDYSDWIFTIMDEPTAGDEEGLKPFLDIARKIREVDPQARISFNPGEVATLATFKTLDPWCDFWLPYTIHRVYHPSEAEAKRAIFTVKPWMWYTTPCLWDKSPGLPAQLYDQIRSVPAQEGNCVGTAFFAFYYPFRDPWDTCYEYLPDAAVTVLPSRHGPVPTRVWEAIREAVQAADLALMVKDRAGGAADEPELKKLIAEGSTAELLQWLEQNGG